MVAQQKSLQFSTTEPSNDVIYVELEIDFTSIGDGAIGQAYTVFENAFGATPTVVGVNCVDNTVAGGNVSVSARPTPTGVTLYGSAVSAGGSKPTGTVLVSATLRGALA
jgi:hypothetical protein